MLTRWLLMGLLGACVAAEGQTLRNEAAPTPQPVLTVTATAQSTVANDRMHASLRAEAEAPDAAQAASEVNARVARALAKAKAVRGVDAATAGYSTYPITDNANRTTRWRVTQGVNLDSADFAALAGVVTRLQSEDKLLISGIAFSVSAAARTAAEDALTRDAIHAWQQRAQLVAGEFGASSWRAGLVTIQGSEPMRPQPMFRAQAAGASAMAAAPVSVEAGTTDISVSVSGEVIVETVRAPTR
jgi:predicted secreted protein